MDRWPRIHIWPHPTTTWQIKKKIFSLSYNMHLRLFHVHNFVFLFLFNLFFPSSVIHFLWVIFPLLSWANTNMNKIDIDTNQKWTKLDPTKLTIEDTNQIPISVKQGRCCNELALNWPRWRVKKTTSSLTVFVDDWQSRHHIAMFSCASLLCYQFEDADGTSFQFAERKRFRRFWLKFFPLIFTLNIYVLSNCGWIYD